MSRKATLINVPKSNTPTLWNVYDEDTLEISGSLDVTVTCMYNLLTLLTYLTLFGCFHNRIYQSFVAIYIAMSVEMNNLFLHLLYHKQ